MVMSLWSTRTTVSPDSSYLSNFSLTERYSSVTGNHDVTMEPHVAVVALWRTPLYLVVRCNIHVTKTPVYTGAEFCKILQSNCFYWRQILSQSHCSDWWLLKSKLWDLNNFETSQTQMSYLGPTPHLRRPRKVRVPSLKTSWYTQESCWPDRNTWLGCKKLGQELLLLWKSLHIDFCSVVCTRELSFRFYCYLVLQIKIIFSSMITNVCGQFIRTSCILGSEGCVISRLSACKIT